MRNSLFGNFHPAITGLQIVFAKPHVKAVATEHFRELASR
jgi:hypothetical protein